MTDGMGRVMGATVALSALALTLMLASALGVFTMAETLYTDDVNEEPTLEDYNAVEAIEAGNGTVTVRTSERPRLADAASLGRVEITHLQLAREDGAVRERLEFTPGVRAYRWQAPDDASGNYTLTLIDRYPADPGIFGHPGGENTQTVTFRVENGTVTNVTVPFAAHFDD